MQENRPSSESSAGSSRVVRRVPASVGATSYAVLAAFTKGLQAREGQHQRKDDEEHHGPDTGRTHVVRPGLPPPGEPGRKTAVLFDDAPLRLRLWSGPCLRHQAVGGGCATPYGSAPPTVPLEFARSGRAGGRARRASWVPQGLSPNTRQSLRPSCVCRSSEFQDAALCAPGFGRGLVARQSAVTLRVAHSFLFVAPVRAVTETCPREAVWAGAVRPQEGTCGPSGSSSRC